MTTGIEQAGHQPVLLARTAGTVQLVGQHPHPDRITVRGIGVSVDARDPGSVSEHPLDGQACNVTRVSDWVSSTPRTRRRTTRFHALCLSAATT
ncbi:hypothetical protein GCM10011578_100570 [Streptomyces fuscichromogenes]|uniref:Uncharacterized protein n=1 Tax=Streptomyces fuscichromogenes TaxID=1324013 RepID=A0A917XQ92_9ACTN|nr:hypothetical protein GCM10011578_100570 [Streptomyces fuscichromogenes]